MREALRTYDDAINIAPNFTDAYYRKGNLLERLGAQEQGQPYQNASDGTSCRQRLESALLVWKQLIRVAPKLADAYYREGQVLIALEREEQRLKKVREEPKLSVSEILKPNQQSFQEIHRNQEPEELFGGHQQIHKESRRKQKPKAPKSNHQLILQEIYRNQDLNDLVPSEELLKPSRQRGRRVPRRELENPTTFDNLFKHKEPKLDISELLKNREQNSQIVGEESEPDIPDLFKNNQQKPKKRREKQEPSIFSALKARFMPKLRYREALTAFEQAVNLRPDNSPYYIAKGDVLKCLGRIKEANQAYKKGDQLQNDHQPQSIKDPAFGKRGNRLRINKGYGWFFPLLALNPLGVPIALGILLQSWEIFLFCFVGEIALIILCLVLSRQLKTVNDIISVLFAAFPIGVGWGFVGWLLGIPALLAGIGFLINVFTFYIIDEWSIWSIPEWPIWKILR